MYSDVFLMIYLNLLSQVTTCALYGVIYLIGGIQPHSFSMYSHSWSRNNGNIQIHFQTRGVVVVCVWMGGHLSLSGPVLGAQTSKRSFFI